MTREEAEKWVIQHKAFIYSYDTSAGVRWDLSLWWGEDSRNRTHVMGTSYEHAVELAKADIAKKTSRDKLSRLATPVATPRPDCMGCFAVSDCTFEMCVSAYSAAARNYRPKGRYVHHAGHYMEPVHLCNGCMSLLVRQYLSKYADELAIDYFERLADMKRLSIAP